jgi:tetratricopeptide (TPR) repeat protein
MKKDVSAKRCLEEIKSILHKVSCAENEEEERNLLSIGREKSFKCLDNNPYDAEINFASGLVMYNSHIESDTYGKYAVKYLKKAIEINPKHEFSKLYLGHYFYDIKDYKKSIFYFENVDEDYFTGINQHWRNLKLNELILCCKIFLSDATTNLQDFNKLENNYLQADAEDVLVPFDLAEAIYQTKNEIIWKRLDVEVIKLWFWEFAEKISFSEPLIEFVNTLEEIKV